MTQYNFYTHTERNRTIFLNGVPLRNWCYLATVRTKQNVALDMDLCQTILWIRRQRKHASTGNCWRRLDDSRTYRLFPIPLLLFSQPPAHPTPRCPVVLRSGLGAGHGKFLLELVWTLTWGKIHMATTSGHSVRKHRSRFESTKPVSQWVLLWGVDFHHFTVCNSSFGHGHTSML